MSWRLPRESLARYHGGVHSDIIWAVSSEGDKCRAGEIESHNNELLNHGNKVKELEAELAAAKERANKHHHHLMGLK